MLKQLLQTSIHTKVVSEGYNGSEYNNYYIDFKPKESIRNMLGSYIQKTHPQQSPTRDSRKLVDGKVMIGDSTYNFSPETNSSVTIEAYSNNGKLKHLGCKISSVNNQAAMNIVEEITSMKTYFWER